MKKNGSCSSVCVGGRGGGRLICMKGTWSVFILSSSWFSILLLLLLLLLQS